MKRISLPLAFAALASASLALAQTPPTTPPKAATTAAKPAVGTASKTGTATHTGTAASSAVKLPPGVPPVRGLVKPLFALRYQDVKIGTGAIAEPNKVYEVNYTGWLASDGTKFDSSFDHPDKAPIKFMQGRRGVIPGWDGGFEGMKVGGKRRLFIPYQLAYGNTGRPPIPPKADLIFDIELVSISDAPQQMPGGRPMPQRPPTPPPTAPGTTPGSPAPGTPAPATPAPASGKPTDPTAPTVAPNSAPAPAPAPPTTPPPTPPTAPPDKPANPAQPNQK